MSDETVPVPAPRIRWAGIVWGVLFCAFGVAVMVELSTAANRHAFTSWFTGLGPGGAALVSLVAVGVFVLILGILGAVSRAQRPSVAGRPTGVPTSYGAPGDDTDTL